MDLTNAVWRKSTYSGSNGGDCVEAALLPGVIAVRDSKDQQGPVLTFPAEAWSAFTTSIKNGSL
jgi:hypothetical protein